MVHPSRDSATYCADALKMLLACKLEKGLVHLQVPWCDDRFILSKSLASRCLLCVRQPLRGDVGRVALFTTASVAF